MSAAIVILPRIWATAAPTSTLASTAATTCPRLPVLVIPRQQVEAIPARLVPAAPGSAPVSAPGSAPVIAVRPQLAFYRKYTEALLTRYVSMSMEAGRVPSLLGREMFRGKVTSYRVHSFEDVVIFVHDVERCLMRLDKEQQYLIRRICLQRFTQEETARVLGLTTRTTMRRYADSLDRLTRIFLEFKLLEPLRACQGAGLQNIPATDSPSTT